MSNVLKLVQTQFSDLFDFFGLTKFASSVSGQKKRNQTKIYDEKLTFAPILLTTRSKYVPEDSEKNEKKVGRQFLSWSPNV